MVMSARLNIRCAVRERRFPDTIRNSTIGATLQLDHRGHYFCAARCAKREIAIHQRRLQAGVGHNIGKATLVWPDELGLPCRVEPHIPLFIRNCRLRSIIREPKIDSSRLRERRPIAGLRPRDAKVCLCQDGQVMFVYQPIVSINVPRIGLRMARS